MVSVKTIEQLQSGDFNIKFRAGGYYHPVDITVEGNRMLFHFGYNPPLQKEIKERFGDRRYHGYMEGDNRKLWSAPITHRNLFQLEALQGKYAPANPYNPWDQQTDYTEQIIQHCLERTVPLNPPDSKKEPFIRRHQVEMINLGLNGHWVVLAGEMGTGKTLAAMIIAEMMQHLYTYPNWWWMGPRSALVAAEAEFKKWDCPLLPIFMTYNGLVSKVEKWVDGQPPPRIVTADESSKCKTPTTQRSSAMMHVANAMRDTWGWNDCIINLLSGSPAPKSPADWWSQVEIVCPGFLREGNLRAFRERLGFITMEDHGAGAFAKLKTWKDTEEKCATCGELQNHANHLEDLEARMAGGGDDYHKFEPCVNEVAALSKRMKGAVGVWLKEDNLDLPAKRYELFTVEPSQEILNAARLVVDNSIRAVDALTRLRTLSDGFLYEEEETGEMLKCEGCDGEGVVYEYYEEENPYDIALPDEVEGGFKYEYEQCPDDEDPATFVPRILDRRTAHFLTREQECYTCGGTGRIPKMKRKIVEVECPKLDVLDQLLERHSENGRLNVYAGFEGSIIRVKQHVLNKGWTVIKADGKGWDITCPSNGLLQMKPSDMVAEYQKGNTSKMVFLGQPGAAGMGLTLTAARGTFYYSNSFNPEDRMQSEDRGHRMGMDVVRGGFIYDVIHLPTDLKIIQSLRKSKNLQLLSMDGLRNLFKGDL